MQPQGLDRIPVGNVMVRAVDLDTDDDPDLQAVWSKQETDTLPWMAVHQPPKHGPPLHVWSGEFTSENVERLIDSPVRQQIRKDLLSGESIVWVLLESGDKVQDDAASDLLNTELARLQGELKLPEIDAVDLQNLSVAPTDLRLSFSSVRLSQDDPREQLLREMLLSVEPDLRDEEYVHQTMAFPVFGRGRALYALIGNGIAPETIEDACRFLTGACQCTVKAQNPGIDLLMSVDWDRHIQPALPYDESAPPLVGLGGFVGDVSETNKSAEADEGALSVEVAQVTDDLLPGSSDVARDESMAVDVGEEDAAVAKALATDARGAAANESAPPLVTTRSEPTIEATSAMIRNLILVMGLLVGGVVLATFFFSGRSR